MKRPTRSSSARSSQVPDLYLWRSCPAFLFRQRADLSFEWATREMERLLGFTTRASRKSAANFWGIIHPGDVEAVLQQIQCSIQSGKEITHTYRIQSDGRVAYISEWRRALRDSKGKLEGFDGFWLDLTRQTVAEQRLLKSAWKEALADLTPGLAHDFNNLLTGVLATSEAYLEQIDPTHAFHEGLSLIKQKAFDASQLIHRISRLYQEKTGEQSYHDLNSLVAEIAEVLRKLIPRRIEVSAAFCADSLPVYLDGVQFRRVLLSLASDAVNGIAGSGKLQFQTSQHETVSKLDNVQFLCLPAACVRIIASEVVAQVASFGSSAVPAQSDEEFPLSVNYARHFVEKSRGALSFGSTRGTAVSIWLPRADFTEGERPLP